MAIAAWTFRLQQAADFNVNFNVNNMSYSEVRLHRVTVFYEADGVTVKTTETKRIGVVELPKSGPGSIIVPTGDGLQPNLFFIAHCRAFQGPVPQQGWAWSLNVSQNSALCGLMPGSPQLGGQCYGHAGVHDPCSGVYEFGGKASSESTISFDVVL